MAFFASRMIFYAFLLYALYLGTQNLLRIKSYHFSPKEFRALAEKNKGEGSGPVKKLAADLRRAAGPHITTDLVWTTFHAGGLSGRLMQLHVSLTEFIVAFNAPFATTGSSGLHFANSTCSVLSGNVRRILDNTDNAETFAPGTNFRHSEFATGLYTFGEKTTVVCYGRGVVPLSSIWALPQSILNDPYNAAYQVFFSLKAFSLSTAYCLQSTFEQVKNKYFKSEL